MNNLETTCVIVHFKLKDGLGGGLLRGEIDDTEESLIKILVMKYGDKLEIPVAKIGKI